MQITAMAKERRHTLAFLSEIRAISPVFLGTDVDMSAVLDHRNGTGADSTAHKYSIVTYVLHTAARVLVAHPEANAAVRGRVRPRVARYSGANGKLTLDRTVRGQRIVLSAVLPGLERSSLAEVQERVSHLRDGDPANMPEFAGARVLQGVPRPVGGLLFRLGVRPLGRRGESFGTFAVTSLGHRPVDDFYSVGGTTITLGVGRIAQRPVVRDGEVVAAPVLRLSLTFDHRVIDGAEAADVLADLKEALEGFRAPEGPVVESVEAVPSSDGVGA
ncbi:2-oxo acid dehydrogenase subunit E2 [Streptomyces sp. WI04-05B]|uniref:2-oxo acid dehydrogenase subunit E2 n=1 Tax=Streptomyces TaxID=1883 RepID=UPI0029B75A53|nr:MULTISPECIES: 2-oxo acid dehydrogenase subunit E2 [unclassified Streptomyces]MDX2548880.1 2-oxo acid dehydrogenase subunit E2 [Streptomyces sp. WI04-05B]MDX2590497.1 2-oxo acid dehydrogenase subunit E2 [Streptomyces sp. WI04-05A]MDX3751525.1 2-oxo acid dehydrogenase subunit E2 [Streptomyces sp. AK08-02]